MGPGNRQSTGLKNDATENRLRRNDVGQQANSSIAGMQIVAERTADATVAKQRHRQIASTGRHDGRHRRLISPASFTITPVSADSG